MGPSVSYGCVAGRTRSLSRKRGVSVRVWKLFRNVKIRRLRSVSYLPGQKRFGGDIYQNDPQHQKEVQLWGDDLHPRIQFDCYFKSFLASKFANLACAIEEALEDYINKPLDEKLGVQTASRHKNCLSVLSSKANVETMERSLALADGKPLPPLHGVEHIRPLNMEDLKRAHEQMNGVATSAVKVLEDPSQFSPHTSGVASKSNQPIPEINALPAETQPHFVSLPQGLCRTTPVTLYYVNPIVLLDQLSELTLMC